MMSEKEVKELEQQEQETQAEEKEAKAESAEAGENQNGQEDNAKEEKQEKTADEQNSSDADEKTDDEKADDKSKRRPRRFARKRKPFSRKKKFTRRRKEERKPEFEQKIISLRRVTRVVAGGRRFSFSVAMVLGDRRGRVGVGVGKSNDTAMAIEKAIRDAKANMITVRRTEEGSIPFDVEAKYGASVVEIRPAPGRGLVAGASVRAVLDLAGVTDVTSKIWTRSKNQINIARATIEALKKLEELD